MERMQTGRTVSKEGDLLLNSIKKSKEIYCKVFKMNEKHILLLLLFFYL